MNHGRKMIHITLAILVMGALAACDRPPEVLQERANLKAVKEKAAKDIAAAQEKAIKDVNDTKEDAARKILAAQKSLHEAELIATGRAPAPTDEYPVAGEPTDGKTAAKTEEKTNQSNAASNAANKDATESSSQSGSTTSAEDNPVTPAECAKYAREKVVKPELKTRYQACSKLHRK